MTTKAFTISIGLLCAFIAGCAADQSAATSPAPDPGYTPTGSNIPRRSAPKADQPAVPAGPAGTTRPAQ